MAISIVSRKFTVTVLSTTVLKCWEKFGIPKSWVSFIFWMFKNCRFWGELLGSIFHPIVQNFVVHLFRCQTKVLVDTTYPKHVLVYSNLHVVQHYRKNTAVNVLNMYTNREYKLFISLSPFHSLSAHWFTHTHHHFFHCLWMVSLLYYKDFEENVLSCLV